MRYVQVKSNLLHGTGLPCVVYTNVQEIPWCWGTRWFNTVVTNSTILSYSVPFQCNSLLRQLLL